MTCRLAVDAGDRELAPFPAFWPASWPQFDGGAWRVVRCRPRGRGRGLAGLSYSQRTRLATMGALPPRLARGSPRPAKSARKSVSRSLANSSSDGRSGSARRRRQAASVRAASSGPPLGAPFAVDSSWDGGNCTAGSATCCPFVGCAGLRCRRRVDVVGSDSRSLATSVGADVWGLDGRSTRSVRRR